MLKIVPVCHKQLLGLTKIISTPDNIIQCTHFFNFVFAVKRRKKAKSGKSMNISGSSVSVSQQSYRSSVSMSSQANRSSNKLLTEATEIPVMNPESKEEVLVGTALLLSILPNGAK